MSHAAGQEEIPEERGRTKEERTPHTSTGRTDWKPRNNEGRREKRQSKGRRDGHRRLRVNSPR